MSAFSYRLSFVFILLLLLNFGCKKDGDGGGIEAKTEDGVFSAGESTVDFPDEWEVSKAPAGDNRQVWVARCPGERILHIAFGEGILCVQRSVHNEKGPKTSHFIEGLDPNTGEFIWRDEFFNFSGSLTIADGKVFTGRTISIHCIDTVTGKRLWDYDMPRVEGEDGDIVPVYYDGKVYFGNGRLMEDYVYCLDSDTGALVWKDGLGPGIHNIGGVVAAYGKIYATGEEKTGDMWPTRHLYCLDPNTGSHLSDVTENHFTSAKYPPGDYYYYYLFDQMGGGEITRFDRTTGNPTNKINTARNLLYVTSDRLYVGNASANNSPLVCLDAASGDVLWEKDMGGFESYAGYAIYFDGGKVYTAYNKDGRTGLCCLDAVSGEELWFYGIPAVINPGNICASDKYVYVATDDGNLYCLRKN